MATERQRMSPLEEQSEAIFSQLLEHGSNGAELTRNSELRVTEVESASTLEANDGGTLVAPILLPQATSKKGIGGTLNSKLQSNVHCSSVAICP